MLQRLQHWLWFGSGALLTWVLYVPIRSGLRPLFADPTLPAVLADELSTFSVVLAGGSALILAMGLGWIWEYRSSSRRQPEVKS